MVKCGTLGPRGILCLRKRGHDGAHSGQGYGKGLRGRIEWNDGDDLPPPDRPMPNTNPAHAGHDFATVSFDDLELANARTSEDEVLMVCLRIAATGALSFAVKTPYGSAYPVGGKLVSSYLKLDTYAKRGLTPVKAWRKPRPVR